MTVDLNSVKAGEYELLVLSWDQITSKPGQPLDYVTHRKGDVVTLDVEQARRLVAAGAVRKVGAKSKGAKAAEPPADPPPGEIDLTQSVDKILDAVGDDPAKAAAVLEQENTAETPRKTLVEPLQSIIDAAS